MSPVVEFSANKYVEYRHGDCNVILSVPHGGGIRATAIPDRDAGALVDGRCVYNHEHTLKKDPVLYPVKFKKDMFTQELAQMVATEFHRITGKRPHMVLNHLYRGKMDPNCNVEKGAFGVPLAVEAWTAYHMFIEQSQAAAAHDTPSLLLDLHGQVHSEDWVELGYTLTKNQLNSGEYTSEMTSVCSLFHTSPAVAAATETSAGSDIKDLICGEFSFGALLGAEGYKKVVPSPSFPCPGDGKYYTGGYITETHGSRGGDDGGGGGGRRCDAIQIESPSSLRTTDRIIPFSQTLALVINNFVKLHYNISVVDESENYAET